MFIWQQLVKRHGKKNCWILCSILGALIFYFTILQSSPNYILILSIFLSIPSSGSYLNDAIISDIIDYDEFISDKRSEGLYTVFSSFIPKVVNIFSQSIPIIILTGKSKC